MMLPSITFAVPYYANLAYLRKAVESVLRQSDADWKLVVCDDGAEKLETEQAIAGYRDDRLRYHRNEHRLGMAGNWNRCLDLADTDLVTLLHADDELLPNYATTMKQEALRHPHAVALFCDAEVIGHDSRPRFSLPDRFKHLLKPPGQTIELAGSEGVRALLRGNFIMCPTLCYRKALLRDRRFSDVWKMVQDLELTTRLLLDGERLIGVPPTAYRYRRHAENATSQYTRDLLRFREESSLYGELERAAVERGWADVARVARRKTIIKLNLSWCGLSEAFRLQLRPAANKARFLWQLCRS